MTMHENRIGHRSLKDRPEGSGTMTPEVSNAHNYYRWIVSVFEPYLGRNILDIGGGLGTHLEVILPCHDHVTSIELSHSSVQLMNEKFHKYPGFRAVQADFGDPGFQTTLVSQQFDTITCFNVLEHIQDDLKALQDMAAILEKKRGRLLLFVPAHQWLYGSMDIEAGHYRRYGKGGLKRTLSAAGFELIKLAYFNGFGVMPWFINNRILKKHLDAGGVNLQVKIFDRYLVPVLQRFEALISPPFGQSLVAVGRVKS